MALTKTDIEQAVDFAFTLAKQGAAVTYWTWDDTVVRWAMAGRDGFVAMICRMLGIATERGAAPKGAEPSPLVQLPRAGTDQLKEAGLDDQLKGRSVEYRQVLQFILNILSKWFGPFQPVPTPTE